MWGWKKKKNNRIMSIASICSIHRMMLKVVDILMSMSFFKSST